MKRRLMGMAQTRDDRNHLNVIHDFNEAASGLDDRSHFLRFIDAAERLAREFTNLMRSATRTALERAELMESMAGVFDTFMRQDFKSDDGVYKLENTTRVLRELGEAFVINLTEATIPSHFTTDQLDNLSGKLKSAAQVREDMSDYFPGRPGSAAIAQQGKVYCDLAREIEKVSKVFGGGAPQAPAAGEGRSRRPRDSYRRRF